MKRKLEKLMVLVAVSAIGLVTGAANANLLVFWAFDEGGGGTVGDSSGNGRNGVICGATWTSPGHDGKAYCLDFSGDGDYVIDDRARDYLNGLDSLTISMWIKSDVISTDRGFICCEGPAGYDNRGMRYDAEGVTGHGTNLIKIGITSNATSGTVPGRQQLESSGGVQTTEWQHVAMTWTSGEQLKLYINGDLDSPMANEPGLVGTLSGWTKLIIGKGGKDTGGNSWDGLIDDVAIFDHALGQDEIVHLYHAGAALFYEPTLLTLSDAVREAKGILKEQNPKKAIALIERKIAQHEQWQEKNPNDIRLAHKVLFPDLYFLLAKAKEAAGEPTQDVIAAYKKSVSLPPWRPNLVPAVLWLFRNISGRDYADAVKKSVRNSSGAHDNLHCIAKDFESSRNWTAFKFFLDAVFSEVNDSTSFAKAMAAGLRKDGLWAKNFSRYARSKPKLTQYIIETCEKHAQEKIAQNKFLKAAEVYRDIVNQCGPEQDKTAYELKVCECIFKNGECDRALSELNDFINNNESVNKASVAKAMLLKGQIYIQLSEIDRACDTFSRLMRQYPETERAPDASFFIGYCNMLQGKYGEAAKALNLVVKNYPQNSYASKAHLCLARIKRVTK